MFWTMKCFVTESQGTVIFRFSEKQTIRTPLVFEILSLLEWQKYRKNAKWPVSILLFCSVILFTFITIKVMLGFFGTCIPLSRGDRWLEAHTSNPSTSMLSTQQNSRYKAVHVGVVVNKPLQASPSGGRMWPPVATNAQTVMALDWLQWGGKCERVVCMLLLLSENSGVGRSDGGEVGRSQWTTSKMCGW